MIRANTKWQDWRRIATLTVSLLVCFATLIICVQRPAAAQQTPSPQARLALVDPFIGTGPDGHTFPGATVPFGMVQLSPDTQIRPFKQSYKWASGYRYEDSTILGFSHTHFSGSGHSDLGDVLLAALHARAALGVHPEIPSSAGWPCVSGDGTRAHARCRMRPSRQQ